MGLTNQRPLISEWSSEICWWYMYSCFTRLKCPMCEMNPDNLLKILIPEINKLKRTKIFLQNQELFNCTHEINAWIPHLTINNISLGISRSTCVIWSKWLAATIFICSSSSSESLQGKWRVCRFNNGFCTIISQNSPTLSV